MNVAPETLLEDDLQVRERHSWIRLGSQTPPGTGSVLLAYTPAMAAFHDLIPTSTIPREFMAMDLPEDIIYSRARAMAFTRPRSIHVRVRRLFHDTAVEAGGEPFPNQSSGHESDRGLVRVVSGRAGMFKA